METPWFFNRQSQDPRHQGPNQMPRNRRWPSCIATALILALPWGMMKASPRVYAQSAADAASIASWSAPDTKNQQVSLAGAPTTLLVFLRPGQPQSAEVIKLLAPLVKDRKGLQVVGVVSGDDAATAAPQLQKTEWPFAIIADDAYATSGKFSVRTWPTVIVAGSKGELIAHLPGLPQTFANDLSAYLDFSGGKIDKAALDKALTNHEVVAESEDQKAARHAEVALRLAQQGLPTQAAAEVARALEFKPTSPPLLASLTRTDLLLGDIKAADALLAKFTPGDLPPSEYNFLKGWAAVQANRWADAKAALLEAVKLNPNPAEAFYLLGRVYDHDNDAPHAAEAYRNAFEHTGEGKPMSTP